MTTPTNPQADKQCTCTPQYPNLRNGSGHYEGCPLWFPLSTTHLADKLPPIICGACNTEFTGETAIKQCQDHIKAEHTVEPEQSSNGEELREQVLNQLHALYGVNTRGEYYTFEEADQYNKAANEILALHQKEVDRLVAEAQERTHSLTGTSPNQALKTEEIDGAEQ